MIRVSKRGILAGALVAAVAAPNPALATSEITVYAPFRGIATPIARAGSAVTVITREEIEQAGAASVAEILQSAPGVSFTSAGGFGSNGDVFIRGGENQHTMVLIDGIPVSNPTSTRNTFDYSSIAPDMIESIEVLRGPQSALYGSDAMGGVINIITRQASNGLSALASIEGGSFGTHREVLQAAYGGDGIGLFGSISHAYSDGFSRRESNTEDDSTRQVSGFIRGTVSPNEDFTIDAQFQANRTEAEHDQLRTDNLGFRDLRTYNGSITARHESFDDRWINTLRFFAGITDNFDDKGADVDTNYDGSRVGGEWTSQFNSESWGTLLVGGGVEQQAARQAAVGAPPSYDVHETHFNAFFLHQFSLLPNFHLSVSGRVDDFDAAGIFYTGRATAVYEIFQTETRVHASIGTGANAPSLYQRFGEARFNPNLSPDESIGGDFGITQILFDGRATFDVTGFYNSYDNLIDYQGSTATGMYVNIAEAETYGVEVSADARLIPGHLDASAAYTYLEANDVTTGLRLARRPEHEGQVSLTYHGIDRLTLTATTVFKGGEWFDNDSNTRELDGFARVDLYGSYQANDHIEFFGRIENLFDTDYQVRSGFRSGYNTPGFSAYAGVRGTFN